MNENYLNESISILKEKINESKKIVVGAGAGFSTASGHTYSGPRFTKNFADFIEKYGYGDMYSAAFEPYETLEELWAYFSRHIMINRYDSIEAKPHKDLLQLIHDKDYFVLTTNVDHLFQKTGFDKNRLFYTQGDYGLFQCSVPCHNKTYDNKDIVEKMVKKQNDMKIPTELIPCCPVCGKPMTTNLRKDDTFVEDDGWKAAAKRYETFLNDCKDSTTLFLELGVGMNTPGIIKYPFLQMNAMWENSFYISLNMENFYIPQDYSVRTLAVKEDIGYVLRKAVG